jgi:hypothetical protein
MIDATKEAAIRAALASGKGILKTGRECGTSSSVMRRIKKRRSRPFPFSDGEPPRPLCCNGHKIVRFPKSCVTRAGECSFRREEHRPST